MFTIIMELSYFHSLLNSCFEQCYTYSYIYTHRCTHMYLAEVGYLPLLCVEIILRNCVYALCSALIIYSLLLPRTVHPTVHHLNTHYLNFINDILKIAFFS